MNFFRSGGNQSKANQRQPRNTQRRNVNQRSDYHDKYEPESSDDESKDLLVYDWSKVIQIYKEDDSEIAVFTAEIDTDHMKTGTKGARGRPL